MHIRKPTYKKEDVDCKLCTGTCIMTAKTKSDKGGINMKKLLRRLVVPP